MSLFAVSVGGYTACRTDICGRHSDCGYGYECGPRAECIPIELIVDGATNDGAVDGSPSTQTDASNEFDAGEISVE